MRFHRNPNREKKKDITFTTFDKIEYIFLTKSVGSIGFHRLPWTSLWSWFSQFPTTTIEFQISEWKARRKISFDNELVLFISCHIGCSFPGIIQSKEDKRIDRTCQRPSSFSDTRSLIVVFPFVRCCQTFQFNECFDRFRHELVVVCITWSTRTKFYCEEKVVGHLDSINIFTDSWESQSSKNIYTTMTM